MRVAVLSLVLLGAAYANILNPIPSIRGRYFERIATYFVCQQIHEDCDTDTETSAEIVDVFDNGEKAYLVYTDSSRNSLGYVDITLPDAPRGLGVRQLPGSPTSVAVCGNYAVVVFNTSPDFVDVSGGYYVIELPSREFIASGDLPGQPDSISATKDCSRFVVAIENERDEDLEDGELPQAPPGLLAVIDSSDEDPENWVVREVVLDVSLNIANPTDPEPEFVAINKDGIAVVTFQENNGLAIVDVVTRTVLDSFTAGRVDLENIDNTEDGEINFVESVDGVPREPDGVTWINDYLFATVDEGDLFGGTRGFTIYAKDGSIVYTEKDMDYVAARVGHYPELRSENKGGEPEGITFAEFGNDKLLFVLTERSSLVYVYDLTFVRGPVLLQVLPVGAAPEGVVAIPGRDLLAVASEEDDRAGNIRSSISIYRRGAKRPAYPTIASANENGSTGLPIPWGALSGMTGQQPGLLNRFKLLQRRYLYAVHDDFYTRSRVFTIDYTRTPAQIVNEAFITDPNEVLRSNEGELKLKDAVNSDNTVNLDLEGISTASDGGFWVVSEGRPGSDRTGPENLLIKLNEALVIQNIYKLDDEGQQGVTNFGFEGVAEWNGNPVVCIQRPFTGEDEVRIGVFKPVDPLPDNPDGKPGIGTGLWEWYLFALPQVNNTDWLGLSEITHVGDGEFYVVVRDNRGGPDAAVKGIYSFNLNDVPQGQLEPVKDLMNELATATKGPIPDKVEGMAMDFRGRFYIVTDNDGVDGSNGETLFLSLEKLG